MRAVVLKFAILHFFSQLNNIFKKNFVLVIFIDVLAFNQEFLYKTIAIYANKNT